MNNEIKQGDKVRVSRDIPQFYLEYNSYRMFEIEHRVVDVNMEDGFALLDSIPPKFTTILPIKYLVKVEAEAKEAKFKVGEEMFWLPSKTIRHKCTITEVIKNEHSGKWEYNVLFEWGKPGKWIPESELALYTEPTAPTIKTGDRVRNVESGLIGVVDKIVYGNIVWVNGVDGKRYHWKSDELELIEPTERTEAKETFDDQIRDVLNGVEHQDFGRPIQTAMINLDINDWDAYAADLAKEIAVKVANKYNDPKQAAEYAVSVAKAVVEGLKRK